MYIVYRAYDDNTADILDIVTMNIKFLKEAELIKFGSLHDVLGLSVSNKKINYINAYNCISFADETEADEYINEMGLSYKNKRYINGIYYVLFKSDLKLHVDYYILTYRGDEKTYVAEKGYTPYIQAAKAFDKRTAGEKAALMTKKSKTNTVWVTERVVNY